MWALGFVAAASEDPSTAIYTALIGSMATVVVALIGLVGTILVSRNRRAESAGEDDDTVRDHATLIRSLAETVRERDDAVARAEACEQRERGRHDGG